MYKAYEANEVTMSKIVLKENGDAYYEKMGSSGCKFIIDICSWKELLHQRNCFIKVRKDHLL